jgi:hypothetical protein
MALSKQEVSARAGYSEGKCNTCLNGIDKYTDGQLLTPEHKFEAQTFPENGIKGRINIK